MEGSAASPAEPVPAGREAGDNHGSVVWVLVACLLVLICVRWTMTINQELDGIRVAGLGIVAELKLVFAALTESVVQQKRVADALEKLAGSDDVSGIAVDLGKPTDH